MSEIRINISDNSQTISGDMHGSIGDLLVAALTAEPETVAELEIAIQRFIEREADWSPFRFFRKFAEFEPFDAGLLVIDLVAKIIMADSTYSYYSKNGKVRIKTDTGEDFNLPYKLSDDWKVVGSMPEYEGISKRRRDERLENPPIEIRKILFEKPLFEFIVSEYLANKTDNDDDLFTNIHAKWLMTARADLCGQTPREVLLEKCEFIGSDLDSRARQWSLTGICPPPISIDSNAYKFAGFGMHEIIVYYDLFRHLLGACFENDITNAKVLEQISSDWLNNPQSDFSVRTPAEIIETERKRVNLTASAHECLIDEDCEMCQMLALDFIDTPTFCHFDGSHMEFDRFEFSFYKTREPWEAEQREYEEFSRQCDEKRKNNLETDGDFFDENQELF